MKQATGGSINNLKQSMYGFGQVLQQTKVSGRKKKNSHRIPVQVTTVSRRLRGYKHRGRSANRSGRRVKDQPSRSIMVIEEDDDGVYHSLPRQKKTKRKPKHSMNDDVTKNRPSAKKH